jgi:hypothetical protein
MALDAPPLDTIPKFHTRRTARRLFLAAVFRIKPAVFQELRVHAAETDDSSTVEVDDSSTELRTSRTRFSFADADQEAWTDGWAREHRLLVGERSLKTEWLFPWCADALQWHTSMMCRRPACQTMP